MSTLLISDKSSQNGIKILNVLSYIVLIIGVLAAIIFAIMFCIPTKVYYLGTDNSFNEYHNSYFDNYTYILYSGILLFTSFLFYGFGKCIVCIADSARFLAMKEVDNLREIQE